MTTDVLANTITVTDENFESEVIDSDIPVLVDFWAEWCGPCKIIGPTIDSLAYDYHGRIKVAKVNVDDSPHSARRFGIQSIPTISIFEDGQVKQSVIGVTPQGQLAAIIDNYID